MSDDIGPYGTLQNPDDRTLSPLMRWSENAPGTSPPTRPMRVTPRLGSPPPPTFPPNRPNHVVEVADLSLQELQTADRSTAPTTANGTNP